jgi:hypothetical protein
VARRSQLADDRVLLLALALMGFAMKFVALILPATIPSHRPHLYWLLPHRPPIAAATGGECWRALLRTALLCALLVTACWIY